MFRARRLRATLVAGSIAASGLITAKLQAHDSRKFVDHAFPANKSSLTRTTPEIDTKWGEIVETCEWRSPPKDWKIVADGTEPGDIRQGKLGDCYFLAALAALTERQHLLDQILPQQGEDGKYSIQMTKHGLPTTVVVDDLFPCKRSGGIFTPYFTRPNGKELWVLLLEKAWTKLHGSYQARPTEIWHILRC
jgi:calpain-15